MEILRIFWFAYIDYWLLEYVSGKEIKVSSTSIRNMKRGYYSCFVDGRQSWLAFSVRKQEENGIHGQDTLY